MNKRIKLVLIAVLIIAILIVAAVFVYFAEQWQEQKNVEQAELVEIINEPIEVCEQIRKIDGLCYDGEEPGLYAVMIENHSDARPQSGLAEASLVYEAIVEAPITRFLAIFTTEKNIEKIGPVRSARPFYIDWSQEFSGPYVHVGGSNEALDLLAKSYSFDLNEFSNGQYFWRAWTRREPHNVYTSSELIGKAAEGKGWEIKNDFASWKYSPEVKSAAQATEQTIEVDFATAEYSVQWEYDQKQNNYIRYQAGKVFEDKENGEIRAKNVAVMYTDSKVIDDYGRRETRTIGSGEAIVFIGGEAKVGEWRRPNLQSRTRFYDEAGQEISFLPGSTWIEVVPIHFPAVSWK